MLEESLSSTARKLCHNVQLRSQEWKEINKMEVRIGKLVQKKIIKIYHELHTSCKAVTKILSGLLPK
jgi:hypothetical protein